MYSLDYLEERARRHRDSVDAYLRERDLVKAVTGGDRAGTSVMGKVLAFIKGAARPGTAPAPAPALTKARVPAKAGAEAAAACCAA